MLETRAFRRLTSLLALTAFLAAAGGEVFGYDPCPHHLGVGHAGPADVGGTGAADGDAEPAAHGRDAGHARTATGSGHAAGPADGADSSSSSPVEHSRGHAGGDHSGGDHSGPCTCIGTCHATATAPVVSWASIQQAIAPRPSVVRRPVAAVESPHRRIVGKLLPYPNGPPTS
ncbi:MAG: hypothetical protein ACODAE_09785 [Gemmatimonadota bacterium]